MSSALNPQAAVDRRAFVSQLLQATPDALVVTGLGSPSYDVFAAGDRDHNFYLWGAMGAAAAMGLGLALAQPDRSVLVITGDGEQLMGVGSLGTIGVKQPKNLTIVVLDNGHFGETGMQRSHTSLGTDLVAVARGFGIADARRVASIDEAGAVAERVNARGGVSLAQVFIRPDEPPRALPPRDGVHVKNRFRAALGLPTF
ncbi:3D-(3,5/4)-trihydroxycyclohexane-1,2-dione hydrolase [compost metagenome]|uniref:thiamine pyrophosphate-dependent enzyme n=1 Tax=Achromobacter sp. Root83 TaxID=1736602 RepID=UPI00070CDFD1|nr:thiamine pyrophosphate-dependent enzyme [Achromobacter sp. Root83]KRC86439.1 aldehyde dehydrogenase [Achromobacter sp. Root83]